MKKRGRYESVECFYCTEPLGGPQGRSAHIRGSHPGLPYHPTPEDIAKYRASTAPAAQAAPANAAPLTPREHVVAAIAELKEQLESTAKQIPALEAELNELRASRTRMERDLTALDAALEALGGVPQPQAAPTEPLAQEPAAASTVTAAARTPGRPGHSRSRRRMAGGANA